MASLAQRDPVEDRALLSVYMKKDDVLRLERYLEGQGALPVGPDPFHLDSGDTDRLEIFYILPVQACLEPELFPLIQNTSALAVQEPFFEYIFAVRIQVLQAEIQFQEPLVLIADLPDAL